MDVYEFYKLIVLKLVSPDFNGRFERMNYDNDLETFIYELSTSIKWEDIAIVMEAQHIHGYLDDPTLRIFVGGRKEVEKAKELTQHVRQIWNEEYADGESYSDSLRTGFVHKDAILSLFNRAFTSILTSRGIFYEARGRTS